MDSRPANPVNTKAPFATSAISGHLDTRTAATEVAEMLIEGLGKNGCDLALLFGSYHHRAAFDIAADIVRTTIAPATFMGVTAEAILGNDKELDGVAGMSAIALRMPGVKIHSWTSTPDDPIPLQEPEKIRERIAVTDDFRVAILLADPFTTPTARLFPALTTCGVDSQEVFLVGGMASGASQPGFNVLVLNDKTISAGAIGVSLSGNLQVDYVVSQGCRPIGKPLVVTKCKENIIFELGGRKPMEVMQEFANEMPEKERELLSKGLLIGTVIDEYKERFGRGDFLVRNLMGVDQQASTIAVAEMCRVGQTIQFHVRDAETAAEDLQLLLDAQVMNEPPFAALLFSCNGRGERLFGQPNHDITVVRDRMGDVPIAGFFAAGEIGPIGHRSWLHGHTASLVLLRSKQS